jgi:hypothetical protein
VFNNELADRNSLATHLDMFKKKRPFKYKQPLRINLTKVKDIVYSIEYEGCPIIDIDAICPKKQLKQEFYVQKKSKKSKRVRKPLRLLKK